jgi:hypothetical protein
MHSDHTKEDPLARVLGQLEAEYEDVMCVVCPYYLHRTPRSTTS